MLNPVVKLSATHVCTELVLFCVDLLIHPEIVYSALKLPVADILCPFSVHLKSITSSAEFLLHIRLMNENMCLTGKASKAALKTT